MTSERNLCCSCFSKCQRKWDSVIENAFGKLGSLIYTYPVKIIIVCIAVNLLLTIGIMNIEVENDAERLYTPMDSQAIKDRSILRNLYGDSTNSSFRPYQLSDFGLYGDVMILSKNKSSIMNQAYVDEINNINTIIRNTIIVSDSTGQNYTYDDLCAGSSPNEGIASAVLLMDTFQKNFIIANITYPFYGERILSPYLAQASHESGKLNSAIGVKLQYYLRQSDVNAAELSKQWEKAFVTKLESLQTNLTDIAYAFSDSLGSELNKNTNSDIGFFSVTFALMMTYASLASWAINCNNVANRMNLGIAGVIAPVLAIASSFGFVSAIGVQFTNIVGVMPFLVIGIGIDDMFILMSGIADAPPLSKVSVKERVIFMMKKSAVAISITSITDLLAFAVGASSVFKSIRNFCIYTGVSVSFCYLNQLFFVCPAITINEHRTNENRHFCCYRKIVKPKTEYENKSKCFLQCIPGSPPETRNDVESPLEKYPKKVILLILNNFFGKCCVVLAFLAYLSFSIYGCFHLQQGLQLFNLVSKDSYFYKYSVWDENYFTTEPVITFCVSSQQEYHLRETQNNVNSVLSQAKMDNYIDENVEINWLKSYKQSVYYRNSSELQFIGGLKAFLASQSGQSFKNDIVMDTSRQKLLSSKFYLKAKSMKTSNEQGGFMTRIRKITENTNLPLIIYTPPFVFFEQYVQILPSTLQTVGIAIAAILVVTVIFMPDLRVVVIVCITLISILCGIFGFMYYWDLTLSSITMIHLVMSVGFSVDFSVHICHAFMTVEGFNRDIVLRNAIDRSGGPVLNAAFSTLLGIAMLAFSTSYIFKSFGILMFLVIGFGLIHASFFLPLLMYAITPCFHKNHIPNSSFNSISGEVVSGLQMASPENSRDFDDNKPAISQQKCGMHGNDSKSKVVPFRNLSSGRPGSSTHSYPINRQGMTTDIGDGYKMYQPRRNHTS